MNEWWIVATLKNAWMNENIIQQQKKRKKTEKKKSDGSWEHCVWYLRKKLLNEIISEATHLSPCCHIAYIRSRRNLIRSHVTWQHAQTAEILIQQSTKLSINDNYGRRRKPVQTCFTWLIEYISFLPSDDRYFVMISCKFNAITSMESDAHIHFEYNM